MEEKSGCRSKYIVGKTHEVGAGGKKQAEKPRLETRGNGNKFTIPARNGINKEDFTDWKYIWKNM